MKMLENITDRYHGREEQDTGLFGYVEKRGNVLSSEEYKQTLEMFRKLDIGKILSARQSEHTCECSRVVRPEGIYVPEYPK